MSGLAKYRCSVFLLAVALFELDTKVVDAASGNGKSGTRDSPPEIALLTDTVSAESGMPTPKPANCGLFANLRETSQFERVRGGPGSPHIAPEIIMISMS